MFLFRLRSEADKEGQHTNTPDQHGKDDECLAGSAEGGSDIHGESCRGQSRGRLEKEVE